MLLVASCYGNRYKLRPDGPTRLVCRLNLFFFNSVLESGDTVCKSFVPQLVLLQGFQAGCPWCI